VAVSLVTATVVAVPLHATSASNIRIDIK